MSSHRFDSVDDFEEWLDRVAADRYSRRRCFSGGNWAALYDTFNAALDEGADGGSPDDQIAVPRWALEAVANVLSSFISTAPAATNTASTRRGGRHDRWVREWQDDLIHFRRFQEVWYRRIARRRDSGDQTIDTRLERQQYAEHVRDRYQERCDRARHDGSQPPAPLRDGHLVDMWTPYPWDGDSESGDPADWSVFDAVSKVFEGTAYEGAPGTIKASYEKVTTALRNGESWRYYPPKYLRFKGQIRTAEENTPK